MDWLKLLTLGTCRVDRRDLIVETFRRGSEYIHSIKDKHSKENYLGKDYRLERILIESVKLLEETQFRENAPKGVRASVGWDYYEFRIYPLFTIALFGKEPLTVNFLYNEPNGTQ